GRISSRGAPVDQPPLSRTSPAAAGGVAAPRHAPRRTVANMRPGTRPRGIDLIVHLAPEQVIVGQAPALTPFILDPPEQPEVRPISRACAGSTGSTTMIPDGPERRECLAKQLAQEPGPTPHGRGCAGPRDDEAGRSGSLGRSRVGASGRRNVE